MGPFKHKQKQSHEFWWLQLLPCGNSEAVHGHPGHNGPPPSRIGLKLIFNITLPKTHKQLTFVGTYLGTAHSQFNNFLSFLFAFTYKGNSLSNPRKKKLTFTVKYEQTSSQKLFNMNNLLTSNQGVVSSDTYFQALKET